MNFPDIIFVLRWWIMFFLIGLIFLPLTTRIFSNFFDKGYIFSKIMGMALISYVVFLIGILKILPFTELTIGLTIFGFLILNIFLISKYSQKNTSEESLRDAPSGASLRNTSKVARQRPRLLRGGQWKIFLFEEILFLCALFFWSFIRAHQPDIHGLEKYMDFGFINSILRSDHFPPHDMWFTPYPINYYYFGHLVTAVLTKLSVIPSAITFNLMLSTIFAFTFTAAFSIGANLIYLLISKFEAQNSKQFSKERFWSRRYAPSQNDVILASERSKRVQNPFQIFIGGLLTAFIVSLAGNLHTLFAFFKPYPNENPVPFWQLTFSPNSFPNGYWYPNATRFIENTIHEFPIYSSVVSDLHGHFLDVPFMLLTIAVLLSLINPKHEEQRDSGVANAPQNDVILGSERSKRVQNLFRIWNLEFGILLLAFLLAVMYMTNAWDGIIYFLLTSLVFLYLIFRSKYLSQSKEIKNEKLKIKNNNVKLKILNFKLPFYILFLALGFFIFSLPFNLHFKPFASGIGVLCVPEFLTNIEKIGPFLFEKDHCLRSPIWQLAILYGFFYFWAISLIVFLFKKKNSDSGQARMTSFWGLRAKPGTRRYLAKRGGLQNLFRNLHTSDLFTLLLILFSTLLIIIPEFIYVKDIYPGHYRANTMFKLVYQAFIMLSISSAYIMVRVMPLILSRLRNNIPNIFNIYFVFFIFSFLFFILVMIYPYLAINSYYNLKTYQGIDGIKYLKTLYPTDYSAILWINKNIKGQPVILEAQGDSYTDYARVSSNTGLPTVLGWTVHEWLWRGTYDIPSPRIAEVQKLYESTDLEETKNLLKKYKVALVFFGDLERQKYTNLNEGKFKNLGKIIYQKGETKIYTIK